MTPYEARFLSLRALLVTDGAKRVFAEVERKIGGEGALSVIPLSAPPCLVLSPSEGNAERMREALDLAAQGLGALL